MHLLPQKPLPRRILIVVVVLLLLAAIGGTSGNKSEEKSSDTATEQSATDDTKEADDTKADDAVPAEKAAYDAFEPNEDVDFGAFTLKVPAYFAHHAKEDVDRYGFLYVAQSDETDSELRLFSFVDDGDGATYADNLSWFFDRLEKWDDISDVKAEGEPAALDQHDLDGGSQEAALTVGGESCHMYATLLADASGVNQIVVALTQKDASPNSYESDYDQIVQSVRASSTAPETDDAQAESGTATDSSTVSPDFKAAMDEYEAFFDSYVDYMNRCSENPSDIELLTGLSDMLTREAQMLRDFDAIEDEDLSDADMAYYLEVQARVLGKLATVQ